MVVESPENSLPHVSSALAKPEAEKRSSEEETKERRSCVQRKNLESKDVDDCNDEDREDGTLEKDRGTHGRP
ncbi:hypothetical protein AXG93_2337s1050 [Marchantia polymorpha subsp. ruderalis]|uniref:Uncharacterized protein n=1 Tax=Marchantia polymorpha subsp. ruderalis TaxID=1480154 RepID=A0A176WKU9_MARPO|nr:hypothetical protein AXG93_2337s1050 [Marchantia polymorpha subsp. ruderalis]